MDEKTRISNLIDNVEKLILICIAIVVSSFCTCRLVIESDYARDQIGRDTQVCEVIGAEIGCLSHSARSQSDGCRCVTRDRAILLYERE